MPPTALLGETQTYKGSIIQALAFPQISTYPQTRPLISVYSSRSRNKSSLMCANVPSYSMLAYLSKNLERMYEAFIAFWPLWELQNLKSNLEI